MQALFVFPGQGSQYRGIGSDLHEHYSAARDVYAEASSVLGFDVAELSFSAPEAEINLTRNTQPVLLTHHVACLRVLQQLSDAAPAPYACAGHSLGEYSALVAGGRLSFAAALALVKQRGALMGELGSGEMLALPLPLAEARSLAEQHYCAVAGCNLKDQTVVGGSGDDLDDLQHSFAEAYPKKRAVRLKTEGAFHTYYMVAAAERFREQLGQAEVLPGSAKVLCNYTGGFHQESAAGVKASLFYQLFHPVLWLDNLNAALADGVDTIVEFGGGIGGGETPAEKRPNLAAMVKKAQRGSDHQADYFAAINCDTIQQTAAALAAQNG